MSHNNSISGIGEPVQAIRVINENWMLLITVGINIMLSCGKEYVKLAWEFICKPGRENLDFLQVKKSEMTWKTKKYCMYWTALYLEKTLLKSKGGSIRFSEFKNIWHDLNYKNANNFLGFKLPKRYAYWIPLYIRSRCWENDMLSFQIKASHLHICLKWLCQSEIGYINPHFFQIQHTHYQIEFALFNNNGGRTWKTKWIQHNIYIFISISIGISCVYRLAHCTIFEKCQGWYTIFWDTWGTKTTN